MTRRAIHEVTGSRRPRPTPLPCRSKATRRPRKATAAPIVAQTAHAHPAARPI